MAKVSMTGSIENVLAGLTGKIRKSAEKAVWNTADEMYEELLNQIGKGGISPEDKFRYTYVKKKAEQRTVRSYWTMHKKNLKNKDTIGYEFMNRHPASRTIYGNASSKGHPNGFRSAKPHKTIKYYESDGRRRENKGRYELLHRPNQLTLTKWANWYKKFREKFGDEIKYEIRKRK